MIRQKSADYFLFSCLANLLMEIINIVHIDERYAIEMFNFKL